jgi:hypothetical protein
MLIPNPDLAWKLFASVSADGAFHSVRDNLPELSYQGDTWKRRQRIQFRNQNPDTSARLEAELDQPNR